MGALSFKPQFVDPVIAGLTGGGKDAKTNSIRNERKRPLKVGERVALYFAQRSKLSRKIGESVIKSRQKILITENEITIYDILSDDQLKFKCAYKRNRDLNAFARKDGFKDFADMKAFWMREHGKKKSPFPYRGDFYKWYTYAELLAMLKKQESTGFMLLPIYTTHYLKNLFSL